MNRQQMGACSASALYDALADQSRRLIVQYLQNHPADAVAFDTLVEYVHEHHSEERDLERVAVRLHHVNLPKLEEVGLLEYDIRSKTVRYYPKSNVESLLDCLMEQSGK